MGILLSRSTTFFLYSKKKGKFSVDICLAGCLEPLALLCDFNHARGAHHCEEFNGFQNMMSILLLFCVFSALLIS